MNTVERIKQILKDRRIPVSRLERDLGFANGYIAQLKKGTMPAERLVAIADYLDVSPQYLLYGQPEDRAEKYKLRAAELEAQIKNEPGATEGDELAEELQILRDNPETRALLKGLRNMSPEQVRRLSAWIESMNDGG